MNAENQNTSFVYLLHAEGSDRFKIGYSNNPEDRCKKIGQQSPFSITLVCSYGVTNAYNHEQKLHKIFSHRRTNGEWFVFESKDHAKGLLDEFFSIHLSSLEVKQSNNVVEKPSEERLLAKAAVRLALQSRGSQISAHDFLDYLSPNTSLKLSISLIEIIFDWFEESYMGKKIVKDIGDHRFVSFLFSEYTQRQLEQITSKIATSSPILTKVTTI